MKKEEIRLSFQSVFESDYPGLDIFVDRVLNVIFTDDVYEPLPKKYDILNGKSQSMIDSSNIKSAYLVGKIDTFTTIDIYDITICDNAKIAQSRVGIQRFVRQQMPTEHQAFILFHYENPENRSWRFSYLYKDVNRVGTTSAKRYTYLFSRNHHARTAIERFTMLVGQTIDDEKPLLEAFSVETLSDAFFDEYKEHYLDFIQYITGKRNVKVDKEWKDVQVSKPCEAFYADFGYNDKRIRDYVKKMMGRLVFLCFLQRKGWMGNGDQQYIQHLFSIANDDVQKDFLDRVLEPMFFGLLNTKPEQREDLFAKESWDIGLIPDADKIPYLNGGLFEQDNNDKVRSIFPSELFSNPQYANEEKKYSKNSVFDYHKKRGLLDFFAAYNFTIDENDPDDAQVGIDPEMLGRIFENLLEDNKDKGAFYTPKEIVQYMCKESLITYLQTGITDETTLGNIRNFVLTYDTEYLCESNSSLSELVVRKLQQVKICDPAIGSGAFPMGIFKEVFFCRSFIEGGSVGIKKQIIKDNIYGVDIERGAVDIARLRFWLALIIEEDEPHPLPNMDFKIMQGNSLLESYKGINLAEIANGEIVGNGKRRKSAIPIGEKSRRALKVAGWDERAQMGISFGGQDTMNNIVKYIKEYFSVEDHSEKMTLRFAIYEALKDFIRGWIDDNQGKNDPETLNELEDLNLENDEFFLWHTWFKEVFDDGGFDIVIGNPPYIQLQANDGLLADMYQDKGFETFNRSGDIFSLFYELGWQLLKKQGLLCYITSNKWMRNASGKETRHFFASKTNPCLLFDFAGIQLFENATVETNIILLKKEENNGRTLAVTTNSKSQNVLKRLDSFEIENGVRMSFTNDEDWVILSSIEASIQKKVEELTTPLGKRDISINFGVKTGFNIAYIIDTVKREEILSRCKDEKERELTESIIVPVLRGRDIKRYDINWANMWLINVHNGVKKEHPPIDIEEMPSLKVYFDNYWSKLSSRSDKGNTPYNLRNCAYLKDFIKPKIIWGEISDRSKFCYDEDGLYFCEATTFFMTGDISSFLLCYLNSKLSEYLFSKIATRTGMGTTRWKKYKIESLPVPSASQETEMAVDNLYRQYKNTSEKKYLEIIDQIIYRLFNLTDEEIAIIESH